MSDANEDLHELPTAELLAVLQAADEEALAAAHAAAPRIEQAVDAVVACWPRGGRLIYVGAGTSGRIGALDAAECRPTFGIERERVRAIVAGGTAALVRSVEGAEDSEGAGVDAVAAVGAVDADVVVALSASGETPFTCAALEEAGRRGAATVAVTCAADSRLARSAAIPVVTSVGGEIIEGSTRLKAGTAQKLVCNAISTASFIRLGRVWGRHMVAVRMSSEKLRLRAEGILRQIAGCPDQATARALLVSAGDDLPTALVMARSGVAREAARDLLRRAHGDVHRALLLAGEAS